MFPLLLASTSFRRHELLRWLLVPFEVVAPDFEESSLKREKFSNTKEYVEALSLGKAMSVAENHPESIVIGGDTLVDFQNESVGKPRDLSHAREILHQLSGHEHTVYTGVTIIQLSKNHLNTQSAKSIVRFKSLTDKQIEKYISRGSPLGKAGAYAIQEGAKDFVESIDGSMTNVIGLPLLLVAQMLKDVGMSVDTTQLKLRVKEYLGSDE